MDRSVIRSGALKREPLGELQDWYSDVCDALEDARRRRDRQEVVRLLVDKELLATAIDQAIDRLLNG
jgi:hypothetical protein